MQIHYKYTSYVKFSLDCKRLRKVYRVDLNRENHTRLFSIAEDDVTCEVYAHKCYRWGWERLLQASALHIALPREKTWPYSLNVAAPKPACQDEAGINSS